MAIKAVCTAYYVQYDPGNAGKFRANISIAGVVSGNEVDTSVFLDNLDPGILAVNLEAGISNAVKAHLTNNHGYSFGLLDTVRLIGALV